MIAGVIKPSLPRPCNMTVPQSAIAPERCCALTRSEDSLQVALRHLSGDLLVRVWESQDASWARPLVNELRLDGCGM
jgi:hypothetical protein